ncbi:Microsomal signal peptidase 12 kDa subunit (SPC12) [Giardia muris]|uniref:Signal peptidase complex subunit 1 n=1 Tax=Giardia muris TaxID=5742 RepID=A0A4Z1SU51_GIAMU|nr:Microsomal signal peptidase 12 kDa subunit (SPC12) [Giardia muris]|eukprot:TNJ29260.1 Microsomal signal peptidase 12 kDa subunit (SPC12) [Giardia muris]
MDFLGQRRAVIFGRLIIILFAALGLILGWISQDIAITFLIHSLGILFAIVATIPDWPYYSSTRIQWVPVRGRTERKGLIKRLIDRILCKE